MSDSTLKPTIPEASASDLAPIDTEQNSVSVSLSDESQQLVANVDDANESTSDTIQHSEEIITDQDLKEAGIDNIAATSLLNARQKARQSQEEMPFAMVSGEGMTQMPLDLYIPPDALEVILEQFEGPLDLLLYLIRKQNLDILEVNVAEITKQYMVYVEVMQTVQLELAGEYLVMAAMLAEIKSRMLLPRSKTDDDEEEGDPRAELIRRLQEYERFKDAAQNIDEMPRLGRDFFVADETAPEEARPRPQPVVDLKDVLIAFGDILRRADMHVEHKVHKEALSTRERMAQVLDRLRGKQFVPYVSLFTVEEGRIGVVTTFMAILELIKESLLDLVQNEEFGPIHVKLREEHNSHITPLEGLMQDAENLHAEKEDISSVYEDNEDTPTVKSIDEIMDELDSSPVEEPSNENNKKEESINDG
jgi:segregation and condensation protein A